MIKICVFPKSTIPRHFTFLQSLYNESKRIISYQKDASDGEWILFYCELCIVKDDVHFLKWYYYCNGMSVKAICENPIKCN